MARISKKNICEFQELLLSWYNSNGRKFPWRNHGLSQYKLIIAEILLQRTKAERVAKFYQDFISYFPTWIHLDVAPVKVVERVLKPIGLYRQKARRIKELAREMVARKDKLPSSRRHLESIPFFGQYISNSIQLLILKKRAPLLDVNMARLLDRYFKPRQFVDIRFDQGLQNLARHAVNHESCKAINWAILDYAAIVCVARNPKCSVCIFRRKCTFFKKLKK